MEQSKMAKRKKGAVNKTAKRSVKKTTTKRKKAGKRELIDTGRDKRYMRRDEQGQFDQSDDVGRSLASDRRRKAEAIAKPGQGDKGDRAPRKKK
jgi:hypothetical protein